MKTNQKAADKCPGTQLQNFLETFNNSFDYSPTKYTFPDPKNSYE